MYIYSIYFLKNHNDKYTSKDSSVGAALKCNIRTLLIPWRPAMFRLDHGQRRYSLMGLLCVVKLTYAIGRGYTSDKTNNRLRLQLYVYRARRWMFLYIHVSVYLSKAIDEFWFFFKGAFFNFVFYKFSSLLPGQK